MLFRSHLTEGKIEPTGLIDVLAGTVDDGDFRLISFQFAGEQIGEQSTIRIDYPVAGQDNDSQGFRDNFNRIRQSLLNIQGEVEGIQSTISELGGTVYVTATYVTAVKSLTIGPDTITVDTSTNQLVVTAEGKSGTVVLRPNTVQAVIAEALTDSVTTITTGTFAVDDVRNIQVGASVTLKNALRTVTNVNAGNNWLTVDRKSTRLNSSHVALSRMPSSA